MSTWMRVLATFRCYPLSPESGMRPEKWVERTFGKECVFPVQPCGGWGDARNKDAFDAAMDEYRKRWSEYVVHNDLFLPMGSEGSCEVRYFVMDPISDPAYLVTVWGDLRDRDASDFGSVRAWFDRCVSRCNVIDAVCHVRGWPDKSETFECHDKSEYDEENDERTPENGDSQKEQKK